MAEGRGDVVKVLHVVPVKNEANGVYQVARMLAHESDDEVVDALQFQSTNPSNLTVDQFSEIWVHGMWLPREWYACWRVLRNVRMCECSNVRPKLVRMTHGSLSPIYLEKQGKWKKRLVAPIERWLFKRTDRVVVTCEAEKEWCRQWGLENEFEILDLKRFFNLGVDESRNRTKDGSLHVLYLGRQHPLKGVEFLERAVAELKGDATFLSREGRGRPPLSSRDRNVASPLVADDRNLSTVALTKADVAAPLELRIVSDHFGKELERDWEWCDVLCLPTLSENFGLVVAEALERGKRVITTDGAPAWAPPERNDDIHSTTTTSDYNSRLICLKGFRDGTDEKRVELLKDAIRSLV